MLAAAIDRSITVWDTSGWKTLKTVSLPQGKVLSLVFSRDEKSVVVIVARKKRKGQDLLRDYHCYSWKIATGKAARYQILVNQHSDYEVACSSASHVIALANLRNRSLIWDTIKGRSLPSLTGDEKTKYDDLSHIRMALSLDGKTLAWVRRTMLNFTEHHLHPPRESVLELWEVATGHLRTTIRGEWSTVTCISFSADARFVASGRSDGSIQMWDTYTGKSLRAMQAHEGVIHSVRFGPSGKIMVSSSNDATTVVWDVETLISQRVSASRKGK
jgi:WD40 repeat protein